MGESRNLLSGVSGNPAQRRDRSSVNISSNPEAR